ncbi:MULTISPECIES: phage portal protein [Photorhabdus]|uniref:phage portal protein n=1 Tax=Photorhabdus TaxID=29487 RepID=UPI000DCD6407|nr:MULTISPECIES: phage portal protein [Photorhabdus]AXG45007.1 phage portal protein [Photorhabdus laumondii subsp. laumondii]NDL17687.1 phage portal protein [Photorhabdus laumondii subsp. laumondii]NDL49436.1 phage portal protein [Photorhabdus laumondii subsp. laumondii]NDL54030.1 phage portal protein [Photorhabdus laumondii subsp. laumondii]RAW82570.1 phage portal protein [Photorhabdus sp. S5P8-50]
MSRKNRKRSPAVKTTASPSIEAFTFGDPIPVLDRREVFDYLECVLVDNWYEPPISFNGLALSFRSAPHHSSAVYVKRNILTSTFIPHRLLSRQAFDSWALDFMLFGNAYFEQRKNRLGQPLKLHHCPAKFTRRGEDLETYWFVKYGYNSQPYPFPTGQVFHLIEPDINQELYGLPEYLAALPSALLNESATLFRRKYYLNGSHAGYILYISDASQNLSDIDNIRDALKNSKGPGNFRNLFLYAPGGKKDGIQTIPLSEAAAKDEFLNIKNASRDDILAAHRVPPQMMGIIPQNTGGFGDVEKAAKVFVRNELMPLQSKMKQLNDWIGEEVIRFERYSLDMDEDE